MAGTRRPHGSGSIETRSRDYHIVRYDAGTDPNGNRRRKSFVVRGTKKSAEAALREAITRRDSGLLIEGDRISTADLLDAWLRSSVEPRLRPSTYDQYQRDVRLHFVPAFGTLKARDLRPAHIQRFISERQTAGSAAQTVRRLFMELHAALEWATRMQLILRNPADNVEPPVSAVSEMEVLGAEDAEKLLSTARGTSLHSLLYVALVTGARRGELLGLRWSDIDLEKGQMRIDRSIREIAGKGIVISAPKTHRSRRAVSLSGDAIQALRAHRIEQNQERLRLGSAWADHDLVWPSSVGTLWHPSNMYRAYRQVAQRAGFTTVTFHALRHSAASLMVQAGVPITSISAQLGHASPHITQQIYAHALPGMQHEAAEQVSQLLAHARTGS